MKQGQCLHAPRAFHYAILQVLRGHPAHIYAIAEIAITAGFAVGIALAALALL